MVAEASTLTLVSPGSPAMDQEVGSPHCQRRAQGLEKGDKCLLNLTGTTMRVRRLLGRRGHRVQTAEQSCLRTDLNQNRQRPGTWRALRNLIDLPFNQSASGFYPAA